MANINLTKDEYDIIFRIVERFNSNRKKLGFAPLATPLHLAMDISACHCSGCPLNLQGLLDADDIDLAHDVVGIVNHISRGTGELKEEFRPRFAA
jgi:hypothetical protein